MSNASIDTSQTYTSTESTLHSSSSIKPNEQLPPIPQDQSTSGEEIMPFKGFYFFKKNPFIFFFYILILIFFFQKKGRKKRETSIDGTSSLRLSSTQWTETLERRSKSSSSNTLKVKSKRSTYSGKTLSVLIKGNVLNMNRNPFEDFPEVFFFFFFSPFLLCFFSPFRSFFDLFKCSTENNNNNKRLSSNLFQNVML